jgi:hypothetical protein
MTNTAVAADQSNAPTWPPILSKEDSRKLYRQNIEEISREISAAVEEQNTILAKMRSLDAEAVEAIRRDDPASFFAIRKETSATLDAFYKMARDAGSRSRKIEENGRYLLDRRKREDQ